MKLLFFKTLSTPFINTAHSAARLQDISNDDQDGPGDIVILANESDSPASEQESAGLERPVSQAIDPSLLED